jgi:hypothetical protein
VLRYKGVVALTGRHARMERLAVRLPGSDGLVYKRNEPDALDHLALTMLTPSPTAARDLGVKGPELGPALVSPDGTKVVAFVGDGGPADTDPPLLRAQLTDLASGESTDAGFASGFDLPGSETRHSASDPSARASRWLDRRPGRVIAIEALAVVRAPRCPASGPKKRARDSAQAIN